MAQQGDRPGRGRPDRGRSERSGGSGGAGRGSSDSADRSQSRSSSGKPSGGGAGGRRGTGKPTGDRRRGEGGSDRRDSRGGAAGDRRGSDRRGSFSRDRGTERPDRSERSAEQARYDGPEIPEEITGRELDRSVQAQLKSLPEKLALRVARHLVAAGMLLEEDPATAYQHTLAARARASRLAVIREAVGEAAYAAGEYAEALAELKAARRMNGSQEYLAVMADCERALGRPDRALALARTVPANAGPELTAELVIVEAGARRDRGEFDAALRRLEQAPLNSKSRASWVVRLRYAYADTLLAAGRAGEALEWFHRTEAIDSDGVTDAAERVTELERG